MKGLERLNWTDYQLQQWLLALIKEGIESGDSFPYEAQAEVSTKDFLNARQLQF